ncbi:2-hydroxy fatty acid dioxygenase, partial [Tremellales sp. Uapishka_1]
MSTHQKTPQQAQTELEAEASRLAPPDAVGGDGSEWLNVEKELAFYASYHSNKLNVAIHFCCIPLILWSWLIILSHVAVPSFKAVTPLAPGLAVQPTLALAWIIVYEAYYIMLEPFGGITYLPTAMVMYLTATYLATSPPEWLPFSSASHPSCWGFAWGVFLFSWIAQFIGHGLFEKRAPALTENLTQALVLAPFFVHLEFLFAAFDYKHDLHQKIKSGAGKRIKQMNQAAKLKL